MADDLELVLVAAIAENGVIGADGSIPWHYPADLRHFKETTTGHPVILGRRTYRSIADRIGGPLPDRTNVALTRVGLREDAPGADAVGVIETDSLDAAVAAARDTGARTAYVAGGASVYRQFLPRADRMIVTEIPESPDGDTRFPDWDREAWTEVGREPRDGFAFVEYVRRA
jgi:dihydrofolate reductase